MVYAPPPPVNSPEAPQPSFRPAHRRTRSHNVASPPQADGAASSGSGPFSSMGHLPRRRSARKAFYLEDESPSPEPEEEDPSSLLSPLGIDTGVHTFPSILSPTHDRNDSPTNLVPFPRTGSGTLSPPPAIRPSLSPRPSLSRTPSSPVILSNGKPLKPSLKSQSAPHLPDELRVHMRAKSEPSTPSVKSVHFRDDDEIEDVKVYNRQGRPANLLVKPGEETETETEVEGAFPFPRTLGGTLGPSPTSSPPADQLPFAIDSAPGKSSAVPRSSPEHWANVHLESITFPQTRPAAIKGSVLVRNVAFEKNVVVRFTLDDWQTTSEVACKHVVSLPGLPPSFPLSTPAGPSWDRFSFQISLEDYVSKLADKTLWLVVRFTAPGHGEWWDNNAHGNYRTVFQKVSPSSVPDAACNRQQGSFVAPSTLRTTPQSSPLVLSSLPASIANDTPGLYPSAITGKLTASPRGSPGVSPRISPNGSPPQSDSENRKPPSRRRPNMGLGLGLGVNGSNRPPALTRSMSSPPVFTPPTGAYANGFIAPVAPPPSTRGAPPSRQQVDGNLSPLMARLSRLSLSNYSAPSRPVAVPSPSERSSGTASPELARNRQEVVNGHVATVYPDPSLAVPDLKVTASSPPADAESHAPKAPSPSQTPKPSQSMQIPSPRGSPSLSLSGSAETLMPTVTGHSPSTSPLANSSTSTSASSSPMLSTPLESSLTDIPSLTVQEHPRLETREPTWVPLKRTDSPVKPRRERKTSGSGSDSSSSSSSGTPRTSASRTTYQSSDLVLNMPTPSTRGSVNSPFSPVSTPRFSLDAALLAAGARASPSLARSRVDTNDADYAAFVRQWCFARSPSPGGTPVGTPKEELAAQPLGTVRVHVSVPRSESPLRTAESATTSARTTPRGSPPHGGGSPAFDRNAWLGIPDGYGLNLGRSWEAGKA